MWRCLARSQRAEGGAAECLQRGYFPLDEEGILTLLHLRQDTSIPGERRAAPLGQSPLPARCARIRRPA